MRETPLNSTKDADNVNFFQYSLFVNNKRIYHYNWVTDIEITKDNMIDLVKGGRARWKSARIPENMNIGLRLRDVFAMVHLSPFLSPFPLGFIVFYC